MASRLKKGTSNACNIQVLNESCEVNETLRNISPRWKMQILHSIQQRTNQFSLLKVAFPSISDQILAKRLSELTADELIAKTMIPDTVPQQITYTTTKKGNELLKIIGDLHNWQLNSSNL